MWVLCVCVCAHCVHVETGSSPPTVQLQVKTPAAWPLHTFAPAMCVCLCGICVCVAGLLFAASSWLTSHLCCRHHATVLLDPQALCVSHALPTPLWTTGPACRLFEVGSRRWYTYHGRTSVVTAVCRAVVRNNYCYFAVTFPDVLCVPCRYHAASARATVRSNCVQMKTRAPRGRGLGMEH